MSRSELIKSLRYCKEHEQCEIDSSSECPYWHHWTDGEDCVGMLAADAAAALEEDDKRISILEDDLRNRTISNPEGFRICGYSLRDLILFADMCKRNDVQESDLKQAAWNLELAVRAVMNERQEIVKNTMDEISMRFMPDFEKAYEEMMEKDRLEEKQK